jgi:hypothetical protein
VNHDTCVAECRATRAFDDETRTRIWNLFRDTPPPLGYDPAIIPEWPNPLSERFAALRLDPWRLRVIPGSMITERRGSVLVWRSS